MHFHYIVVLFTIFSFKSYSQDTVVLRYSMFGKYNLKGVKLSYAKKNNLYVIGKDCRNRKRIEGKISADGTPYSDKVIRYYKSGQIKSVKFYKNPEKNLFYDSNGNLIK